MKIQLNYEAIQQGYQVVTLDISEDAWASMSSGEQYEYLNKFIKPVTITPKFLSFHQVTNNGLMSVPEEAVNVLRKFFGDGLFTLTDESAQNIYSTVYPILNGTSHIFLEVWYDYFSKLDRWAGTTEVYSTVVILVSKKYNMHNLIEIIDNINCWDSYERFRYKIKDYISEIDELTLILDDMVDYC